MNPSDWFDEGTYSDLTIKLSNGTEIRVHKLIVCRQNEYFRKLCGPDSHFAESKQTTIELEDDDPAALTNILRHIYELPIEVNPRSEAGWRIWLNIRTTADKYLMPALSEAADQKFRQAALAKRTSDDIFDIIEIINNEFSHDGSLVDFANKLRKDNLANLLKNDRFRAQLESGDKKTMWKVLDDLAFAAELKEVHHHFCFAHEGALFAEPSAYSELEACCEICSPQVLNPGILPRNPRRTLWKLD